MEHSPGGPAAVFSSYAEQQLNANRYAFIEPRCTTGLATNLVIYLQTVMGESSASAAIQQMMFEGTCYLTPLLGALLADSRWGRYKTILVFSAIYFVVSIAPDFIMATTYCLARPTSRV